jgi:hypothetical protein
MSPNSTGRKNPDRGILVNVMCGLAILILVCIMLAVSGCSSADPVIVKAAPAVATAPASSVTLIVQGTHDSFVTYGLDDATVHNGHSPMRLVIHNSKAKYFNITAALRGYGRILCRILINGKILVTKTVKGHYGTAICSIDQLSDGSWTTVNA